MGLGTVRRIETWSWTAREVVNETRFEGTKILMTMTSSLCPQPDPGGTYEINVLENSNLQFVAVGELTAGGEHERSPANTSQFRSRPYTGQPTAHKCCDFKGSLQHR